jgi:hypothetical protein
MPPLSKNGSLVFSLLCLALAGLAVKEFHGVHINSTVIGLLALSTAPWSLPWFAELVQSLKIGTMELNFRQHIEQKVEEGQKAVAAALSSGIGNPGPASSNGPGASGLSHSILAAPDRGDTSAPDADESLPDTEDPNKGMFGGRPVGNGRKLSAQVKPFPGSSELFLIQASVSSVDPTRPLIDDTPVTFYLHDSFAQKENKKVVREGKAGLDFVSRGAFTMGAVVHEAEDVPLELDLARDVPDAPLAFISG